MSRTGILAALAVVLAGTASAETITVCSKGCDYTSINAAIAAASDGDVIQLAAETYQEGVEIDTLGKAITLRGTVDADGVPRSVLDGQGMHRVLHSHGSVDSSITLEQVVVANGNPQSFPLAGAGLLVSAGSATVERCWFLNNFTGPTQGCCYPYGGAILIDGGAGEFRVIDSVFEGNYGGKFGGAINLYPGDSPVIEIRGCLFRSNSADNNGGAIYAQRAAVITDCHFESNSSLYGGAISIWHNDIQILDCAFDSNHAATQGGAIFVNYPNKESAPPVIEGSLFLSNSTDGEASVVYLDDYFDFSSVVIAGSVLCGNAAPLFGGLPWTNAGGNCFAVACNDSDGDGTLDECDASTPETLSVPSQYPTIQNAIDAASTGDVIEVEAGLYLLDQTIDTVGKILTIRGAIDEVGEPATILDGQATIRVLQTTTGELADTRFENLIVRNGAADRGAGMANLATSPTIVNCAFESNVASDRGGGMYNWVGSPLVDSSRFAENAANLGGGTYNQDGSQAKYRQCIFRDNVAGTWGGAMRNLRASPLVITSIFEANASQNNGGAIASTVFTYPDPGVFPLLAVPIFEHCAFVGNTAAGGGGAIYSNNASFVVEGCSFEGNAARSGGAIRAHSPGDHPPYKIHGSAFRSNSANDGRGGALYSGGHIQISDSDFVGNSAITTGGAIFAFGPGCILSACRFDKNYAPVGSGLHDISGYRPSLTDCDFTSCCEIVPPWSFTDGGGNDYQAWCDDCRADVNCQDDAVDAADLAYMLGVWGTADPQCDITGDGIVDGADLGALLISWGPCP